MKVKIYNDNIVHLMFSSQKELTMTMCRPQEYYECNSTKLRGKVFTFEEFIDHYVRDDGYFDYFNFWSGFNIPGYVLEEFFSRFTPTDREKELRKVTRKFKNKMYYVIAAISEDKRTIRHELVHAYYYLDPVYKQNVDVIIRHMRKNVRTSMTKELKSWGYASHVMNDEINAYITTSTHKYLTEDMDLSLSKEDMKPFTDLAKRFIWSKMRG